MQVTFYSGFSKRTNSTLLPSSGTTLNVTLKTPTDWDNPVFDLEGGKNPNYEYCYIPYTGHYYFVSSCQQVTRDIQRFTCTIDPLTSYRSSILNYVGFIERSASHGNNYFNDPLVNAGQNIVEVDTLTYTDMQYTTAFQLGGGCFVCSVVTDDKDDAIWGGTEMLVFSAVDFSRFINEAINVSNYSGIVADIGETFFKAICEPLEYIRSCIYLPYLPTTFSATSVTPKYAWWDVDITAYRLYTLSYAFPDIVLAGTTLYGDFRDYTSSFTNVKVRLPGVGVIDIEPEWLNLSCVIQPRLDLVTGEVIYNFVLDGSIIRTIKGRIGVAMPINRITALLETSPGKALETLGQTVTSATTSALAGTPGMGVLNTLSMIPRLGSPHVEGGGSIGGGFAELSADQGDINLTVTRYSSGSVPNAIAGRPCYDFHRLGDLSGYCKCGGASVSVPAHDGTRAQINELLNSGIYIE